jgi:hypothetical protein
MPPNKMMLGISTYGRGDTPPMPYTGFKGESGFVSYYEVELIILRFLFFNYCQFLELYSNCL